MCAVLNFRQANPIELLKVILVDLKDTGAFQTNSERFNGSSDITKSAKCIAE